MGNHSQYRQNAVVRAIPTKTQKLEYLKEYVAAVAVVICIFGPLFYYVHQNG
jgi:hypothetical protein